MKLMTQQAYELLAWHGSFITDICDKCGKGLGAVSYTRQAESGVWCSRECRGDQERAAIRKGGRPRKHKTNAQRHTGGFSVIGMASNLKPAQRQIVGHFGKR